MKGLCRASLMMPADGAIEAREVVEAAVEGDLEHSARLSRRPSMAASMRRSTMYSNTALPM